MLSLSLVIACLACLPQDEAAPQWGQRIQWSLDDGPQAREHAGDHHEYRFEPAASLPSVEDLAAQVTQAHQLELAKDLGPLRMTGEMSIEALNITAEMTTLLEWRG
ncbi:MAG: hypothetical protein ACI9EF_003123 [Pseudohongiellaceae bacterium]|jgi:hypothetical protein